MTEEQLTAMEKTVFEGFEQDDAAELQWCKLQLDSLIKEERQLIASFRMWKAMRDDAKMEEMSKGIDKVRNVKKYIKGRIISLEAPTN